MISPRVSERSVCTASCAAVKKEANSMKNKIRLIIDIDKCWGCKACELACKQELALGPGPRPMSVIKIGPRNLNDTLHQDYVPVMCQHCRQPECKAACPVDAIFKASDGSIQIDSELCISCGDCQEACPYGAIEMSDPSGPVKCTLCFDRRKNGWLPSCVQHCPGRAITLAADDASAGAIKTKKYSWSAGQTVYTSDKWRSLGSNPMNF